VLYLVDWQPPGRGCAYVQRRFEEAGDCMGEFSPIHWLIVLAIIVLLFGGKKIPEVMRGLGEGIRTFKDGMNSHTTATAANPPVNPPPPPCVAPQEKKS
jgi:sec-independent protein translocase protein TatA